MAKNQQKYNFNADSAQANVDSADNIAAMQRCVEDMKLVLRDSERLHNWIKFQLSTACTLEESLTPLVKELHTASQIRVTQRCQDDYNKMCAEVQGNFKEDLQDIINQAVEDINSKMSNAVKAQLDTLRKIDSRVSLPLSLAISLFYMICGGILFAGYVLARGPDNLTISGLWAAAIIMIGVAFLSTLVLLGVEIYKRYK